MRACYDMLLQCGSSWGDRLESRLRLVGDKQGSGSEHVCCAPVAACPGGVEGVELLQGLLLLLLPHPAAAFHLLHDAWDGEGWDQMDQNQRPSQQRHCGEFFLNQMRPHW